MKNSKFYTAYDNELEKINGINWLPWVGSNYDGKILIVGESHYHNAEPTSKSKHDSVRFTRSVIKEASEKKASEEYGSTKLFPNLYRTILGDLKVEPKTFWQNAAFYNFIQKPMDKDKKQTPSNKEKDHGWKVFFEVAKVLQPKLVIFIGVTASLRLKEKACREALKNPVIESLMIDKIGKTKKRKTVFLNEPDLQTKIQFIKHTSWLNKSHSKLWHKHLIKSVPEELKAFHKQLKS